MGTLVFLIGFCLLIGSPATVLAQSLFDVRPSTVPEVRGSDAPPTTTSAFVLNWWQEGDFRIRSTLNVGYKRIGLNFNLNIPPIQVLSPFTLFPNYGSLLDTFPLDAKVQNADLAMGGIRLEAQVTRNLGFFGTVSASVPRSIGIEASEGPGIGVLFPQAWNWNGSRLQWSEFSFGGSYKINSGVGLVAGLRFDRLTVRFSEPQPVPGYRFPVILPLPPHLVSANFPDYSGDLRTFLTIPYLGLEMFGPYFKGTFLIGSASARLQLPLELNHTGIYITGPIFGATGRRDISEQAEYTFTKPGLFLEGSIESNIPFSDIFSCTVWTKGSWTRIRGDGDVNLNGQSTFFALVFTLPTNYSASAGGTSTLTRYDFEFGVSGSIKF